MSLDPKTLQREALALVAVAALTRLGVRASPSLVRRASRARRRGLDAHAFSTRGPRRPAQAAHIVSLAEERRARRDKRDKRTERDPRSVRPSR